VSDELLAARRAKLEALRAAGIDPFPYAFDGVEPIAGVRSAHGDLSAGDETDARHRVALADGFVHIGDAPRLIAGSDDAALVASFQFANPGSVVGVMGGDQDIGESPSGLAERSLDRAMKGLFQRDDDLCANAIADALAPHGGTVFWRAFVYAATKEDRAKQAYDEFRPLDGKFRDNVIVQVKNGPIDLNVAIAGDGPLILCVHGFPELWYSWRHQLSYFSERGYKVAALDVRGYGRSSKPHEIAGAEEAARRLIAKGREALVAYPRYGKDINDLLSGVS